MQENHLNGSLVDNVIKWGVGGLNIDECRVETNDRWVVPAHRGKEVGEGYQRKNKSMFVDKPENVTNENGRFPANLILTYEQMTFDEVCGGFPYTKSTPRTPTKGGTGGVGSVTNFQRGSETSNFNDSGNACRYFYCAKASKKDRDEGLEQFEEEIVNDGRQTPIDNPFQRGETLRKNTHPTVKPTDLMQYLVRLVTPENGIILDPFMGSGSTGKACMYENLERNKNYSFIGIEKEQDYYLIAKARIEYVERKLNK